MPILLLIRLIISTASEDIQVAEHLSKFMKTSKMFHSFIKNPGGFLKTRILGKGKKQAELSQFQKHLQTITNLPTIHKKIMNHVMKNNFAKIQEIQKQYLTGQGLMKKGKEIIMDNIDEYRSAGKIGVYVSLYSSALAGGIWTPIVQSQSGTYGIASLTYISNQSKSYDYFNVSRETWLDMCKARGSFGTGANKVFINQYLGGGKKTRPEMQATVRQKVKQLNRAVEKPNKGTFVVNPQKAIMAYSKYKNYGKVKKNG